MDANLLAQVRSFNRAVTRRIGVLDDDYLGRGRPLSEARLLFETGPAGAEVRDLRARLNLDSGYMSRLLRTLEKQGLLKVAPSVHDARARRATLTAKGLKEVAAYDALSDDLALSLVEPLSSSQRDKLASAMAQVERLLQASAVTLLLELASGKDAQACVAEYLKELSRRFDTGYDPDNAAPAGAEQFDPPKGWFIIARLDGRAVGCGGLKQPEPGMAEIKRLWIAPEARGLGLGRRILQKLEDIARDNGMTRVRLDTNRALHEAQGLYLAAGYQEVERFNDDPYAQQFFAKPL